MEVQSLKEVMASTRPVVFSARLAELGLVACLERAKAMGIDTFAKFAFGCEYTPQHPTAVVLEEKRPNPNAEGECVRHRHLAFAVVGGLAGHSLRHEA